MCNLTINPHPPLVHSKVLTHSVEYDAQDIKTLLEVK